MIRMDPAIEGLPARMLLQVHDELLFEVETGAEDELIARARHVMVEAPDPAVKLSVALEVEAAWGRPGPRRTRRRAAALRGGAGQRGAVPGRRGIGIHP
jgi:hypothetical protein